MNRVFVDTVGFLALWNKRDPWHESAATAFQKLVVNSAELWTTSYVLLECGNAAARTPFRIDVLAVREQFVAAGKLVEPTPADCEMAWTDYQRGTPRTAGIVDHTTFIVMRRLDIERAFTNDRHFTSAGFEILF